MRIVLLTPWYPTPHDPISGTFIRDQARALLSSHEVIVVHPQATPLRRLFSVPVLPLEAQEDGVRVMRPVFHWTFLVFFLPTAVKSFIGQAWVFSQCMIRIRRTGRVDCIHAHVATPAGAAAVLVAKIFPTPVVITEHTGPITVITSDPSANRLAGWAIRSAKAVLAVSQAMAADLRKAFAGCRPVVVPNTIDTRRFPLTTRAPGSSPTRAVVIGQLDTTIKGADILLAAIGQLPPALRDNLLVTIVGDGQVRSQLEQQAKAQGLDKIVHFVGSIPPDAVPAVLADHDFLILPSRHESFGVAIIEAMAAGLPVVATKCGGPNDIVDDQVGILVPPEDPGQLAEGITRLVSLLPSYHHPEIRQRAEQRFGYASFDRTLSAIYQGLAPLKHAKTF